MARVIGSSVPSDLLTFYREILNRPLAINADRAITVSVLGYQPPAPPDSILRLRREQATGTAEWLANHHPTAVALIGRATFTANRTTELMSAVFSPTWFTQTTIVADVTEWGTPNVYTPGPIQPPQFNELLSLNSFCSYTYGTDQYPTPPAGSPLPNPSPGYYAETQSGYFRDVWIAQQRITHALPFSISNRALRPLWYDINVKCNAQASNRYNKLLTAFCTRFDYDISGYFAIPDLRLIAGKSRPEYNRLRYKSAAAPGYNRLITWRKWGQYLPAKLAQTLDPFDSKEIQLIFSPIPTFGRFHYGNTWQQNTWTFDTRIFVPKIEPARTRWSLDPIKL